MKKNKKLLLVVATSTLVLCGALGAVALNTGLEVKESKAEVVDFSTKDITRRVWFVNNDNWWVDCKMYVHAWVGDGGEGKTNVWSVIANKVSGAYHGLYYADVSGIGIGGAINAQVKLDDEYPDAQKWTVDVALPSLGDKGCDVIWLNSGVTDGKRNASVGTLPLNGGEIADVLKCILTCDASLAYGYNAYPQLNADFFAPNEQELIDYGDGCLLTDFNPQDYYDHGKSYGEIDRDPEYFVNVNEKIALIKELYDTKGWTVA